jgi:hypothetical protein
MKPAYLAFALLQYVFALILLGSPSTPLLTLTSRRQFDEWTSLLDAFRAAQALNQSGLREKALQLAWCSEYLPPNTTRAPFCACVNETYDAFRNATGKPLAQAREDAAMDIVGCLSDRPVWRVAPIWSVRYTTPVIYVFFIAACFCWIAADLPKRYSTFPIWVFTAVFVVVLMLHDYVHNSFWVFTFVLIAAVIELILMPGMALPVDPPPSQEASQPLLASSSAILTRTPSCFWWAEYLSAPVFALFVPLMHCGRDLFFVSVFTMIGTAVGGLGLRSFWCSQAYAESPRDQFVAVMQYVVWLGILASCVSLSFMTGIYYSHDVPYNMGPGSVALLAVTFCVSLLQWPGNQNFNQLLFTQMALALARNVAFFALVASDVMR